MLASASTRVALRPACALAQPRRASSLRAARLVVKAQVRCVAGSPQMPVHHSAPLAATNAAIRATHSPSPRPHSPLQETPVESAQAPVAEPAVAAPVASTPAAAAPAVAVASGPSVFGTTQVRTGAGQGVVGQH